MPSAPCAWAQIRTYRQRPLGLGQCADVVAAQPKSVAEARTGFRISLIERNCLPGQWLG
jgi:hypothetical protein